MAFNNVCGGDPTWLGSNKGTAVMRTLGFKLSRCVHDALIWVDDGDAFPVVVQGWSLKRDSGTEFMLIWNLVMPSSEADPRQQHRIRKVSLCDLAGRRTR